MNRGPRQGAQGAHEKAFVEKLAERLGAQAPNWIAVLAEEADRCGLKGAAKQIGYSPTVVSQVISGTYRGDMGRVQETVRGALMGATVVCPILGEVGRERCLHEQRQEFRATSSFRVQLYHACRGGCQHARRGQEASDDR